MEAEKVSIWRKIMIGAAVVGSFFGGSQVDKVAERRTILSGEYAYPIEVRLENLEHKLVRMERHMDEHKDSITRKLDLIIDKMQRQRLESARAPVMTEHEGG